MNEVHLNSACFPRAVLAGLFRGWCGEVRVLAWFLRGMGVGRDVRVPLQSISPVRMARSLNYYSSASPVPATIDMAWSVLERRE